ncbi:MAG: methionine--tRNA ligase [Rhodothermales bacterium]|nr:methionine--tRNA ligase [Rhodothermales bacterium]
MPSTDHFKRLLVTSALPYANGAIHIGHIAGAYLPADIYCRYNRMKGRDVLYICGSDEHGVAIMIKARQEGTTPQAIVDEIHPLIKSTFKDFGMSFDYYGRTSSDTHAQTTTEFFRALNAKDTFVTKTDEQLYDPEAGIFLADRFVVGTCPNCGHENAYGDQCENCGTSLSPLELIEPRSTLTDATPELKETTHWYLPLGDFQERLETWIASHDDWKHNVLGQVKSWLADGLRDRAITRDVPWGIPIPEKEARQAGINPDGKVFYVWFDAPIGYISATREWAESVGQPSKWKTYWQQDDTKLVHFIGKDNIVFHCLMFPAMLMAHGDYVLPEDVPANEFLNLEGQKLSTSRGWAIWLHEYLEDFPADLLRYTLASTFPEAKDSDFSWKDFQARVNNELADVLGNFVNRTMTFAHRFFDGVVPPLSNPGGMDLDVIAQLKEFPTTIGASYEQYKFREGVFHTINLARIGNRYFNDTEPWKSAKSDMEKCANTIHVSLQICAALATLMEPVMPFSAARLRTMLNLDSEYRSQDTASTQSIWDHAGSCYLESGHTLNPAEILFTKIEDEAVQRQIDILAQRSSDAEPVTGDKSFADGKDEIVYDDFTRLDLRVGTILSAVKVEGADRLMQLEVDLGFETRQIVSGIAEHFAQEELTGQQVVVVVNLAPRKIRGLVSAGMVLTAENRDGSLRLVSSTGENGAVVS